MVESVTFSLGRCLLSLMVLGRQVSIKHQHPYRHDLSSSPCPPRVAWNYENIDCATRREQWAHALASVRPSGTDSSQGPLCSGHNANENRYWPGQCSPWMGPVLTPETRSPMARRVGPVYSRTENDTEIIISKLNGPQRQV